MFKRFLDLIIILGMAIVLLAGIINGVNSPSFTNALLLSIFGFLIIRFCD